MKLFKMLMKATFVVIAFAACNNNGKNDHKGHDRDTMQHSATTDDKDVKTVAVIYPNVDAKTAASIKEVVGHYLHIKNALANDNGTEAANGAEAMAAALNKIDKSFFTAEQKSIYDGVEEELKEHAEHIGKNGDNIKHQRFHFSMLSEVVYDLVKAFGAGQPIYHYHCPMYNENKGAMWLSEMRQVKNPYFGAEMPKCGSVEEVIK